MKRIKKMLAGVMAFAMLATCTVFAQAPVSVVTGKDVSVESGDTAVTIDGKGTYINGLEGVFLVALPTAANANDKVAFTVDPKGMMSEAGSHPKDMAEGSHFGTVFFKQLARDELGSGEAFYTNESDPLYVINKSSVDITVNMFATLSDSKMVLASSGGDFASNEEHLSLSVKIKQGSDEAEVPVSVLGARHADVVEAKSVNFEYVETASGGLKAQLVSTTDLAAASALDEDGNYVWNEITYTITGKANADDPDTADVVEGADWDIEGLTAPTLTIKWVVDPADVITYKLGDPKDGAFSSGKFIEYSATDTKRMFEAAQLDKEAYKLGETVTAYFKPKDNSKTLKTVTFTYINVKDGKMNASIALKAPVNATPVNGVYSATFTYPSDMAKSTTPAGATVKTYVAPYFLTTWG